MKNKAYGQTEKDAILIKDLVGFLRDFSVALKSRQTGNPAMSIALSELSKALQPHSDRYLQDVLSEFKTLCASDLPKKSRASTRLLDIDWTSLSLDDVENLLTENELPKKDLIDLGHIRFGISRSKLERQSKTMTLESIRTAAENEKTLHIIGEEAARSGLRRNT